MRYLLAVVSFLSIPCVALAGEPATAGRPPSARPAMAPAASEATEDWAGPYLGARLGYGWGAGEVVIPSFEPAVNAVAPDGFLAGALLGYSFQAAGRLVVGLEAGANWVDGQGSTILAFNDMTFSVWQDWEASIVGRVGVPVGRSFLYGLAGASWAQFAGAHEGDPIERDVIGGWTVGAGIEHFVTDDLRARLEYRYTRFDAANFTCGICDPMTGQMATHTVSGAVLWEW